MNTSPQGSGPAASPAKFQHSREQTSVVQDVSAFATGVVNDTGGSTPQQLRSGRVSADFFRPFGAPVLRGRTFTPEEDRPGGDRVAVLSSRPWTTRFNGDPEIVGKAISLSGEPYTIVGVLGDVHVEEFGAPPQVWVPFQLGPNTSDQGHLPGRRSRPGTSRCCGFRSSGGARSPIEMTAAAQPSSSSMKPWRGGTGRRGTR
jgi:putative ABC transport system permease protein